MLAVTVEDRSHALMVRRDMKEENWTASSDAVSQTTSRNSVIQGIHPQVMRTLAVTVEDRSHALMVRRNMKEENWTASSDAVSQLV